MAGLYQQIHERHIFYGNILFTTRGLYTKKQNQRAGVIDASDMELLLLHDNICTDNDNKKRIDKTVVPMMIIKPDKILVTESSSFATGSNVRTNNDCADAVDASDMELVTRDIINTDNDNTLLSQNDNYGKVNKEEEEEEEEVVNYKFDLREFWCRQPSQNLLKRTPPSG